LRSAGVGSSRPCTDGAPAHYGGWDGSDGVRRVGQDTTRLDK